MTHLIDKDALVAEIKKHRTIWDGMDGDYCKGQRLAYSDVISILDTLEVKEVDLEKEIEEVKHNYKVDNNQHTSICSADIEWLAKHFFELGLKTKGE